METMSETLREPRRAYRDPDDRILGGVASGVGAHLGLDPFQARVGFVILALMGGLGVVVYAALWLLLPVADQPTAAGAPGLESATRRGFRTEAPSRRTRDVGVAVSLAVVAAGLIVFLQNAGLWLSPRVFWPLLVAASGLALLWWQSDESDRAEWLSTSSGWKAWLRVVFGGILVTGAVGLALFQAGVADALDAALGAILLAVVGVGLVIGPWLLRLTRDLRHERGERMRSQERADVAAHLHDSVLQTLALIQRQAGDALTVAQLARTQERELRNWLFDPIDVEKTTLKSALTQAAAEVEDAHRLPIELVVVGDADAEDAVMALVAASREAMVNAAKHSTAGRIDVYGEVSTTRIEVFVRDRGIGFELVRVPEDRMGVRRSIVDRMSRHGGRADVRSTLGEGTEVRMWIPRSTRRQESDA